MTHAPALLVRRITRAEHLAAIGERSAVSFLQTPAWGDVKRDWRSESVGWFDGDALVGAGLVLYRKAPRIRRYLAYLPEGPAIDWDDAAKQDGLQRWLDPLVEHVKGQGAFGLRMGPTVVRRRWSNGTVKEAFADDGVHRLRDVTPDETTPVGTSVTDQLTAAGWRPPPEVDGFAAGQPQHVFQLPLSGRSTEDLLRGFNQLWRRNIKKADKAGVTVTLGTADDLPAFHELYAQTAHRDGFTPRPFSYFQGMWDAMTTEAAERLRLYLAHHEGDLVAATTMVRVGEHAWYSYGASSTAKRDVRGSNAVQWRMIRDALDDGCEVYDLRGITDTLREDDPHAGLIRFKLGTGGEVVEYVGEWDLPISRVLYSAFDLYMKRRS
ncbi:lipid II:glycine glycyltransferase (peptidoglycan interpeptide bridge formation enzyme) [Haloactinopolyspora alba]|uniref:Lipid II:glycine glycyltransferase (Peptidoglycan interpeptide bridge formation enzyme) n=1 Tax=Haloactinopolyspora alba TaxID=648780 RepID=A0A2P8DW00_9ACTN|nr:peptidoglycan bridge formation glycyltransferase FemA/FemB family protein [Haloactinopolyspora alba]PSL01337.1 lipid II:glycine glycyltransferase (peptidoglycan interpeptide bridge formation enzyme) [Haloactinopolyspora alba]